MLRDEAHSPQKARVFPTGSAKTPPPQGNSVRRGNQKGGGTGQSRNLRVPKTLNVGCRELDQRKQPGEGGRGKNRHQGDEKSQPRQESGGDAATGSATTKEGKIQILGSSEGGSTWKKKGSERGVRGEKGVLGKPAIKAALHRRRKDQCMGYEDKGTH